ncbi:ArsR family transcriptional regulator [Haloferax sp. MBLA0076]|uniref:ArsR family transcriptional regulator n=1 Tax=Haloferax litoreum TaxID=2666140 RepID=A0A6A8GLP4_9EURY|nr:MULTISPECIES: ArsR family transcriptional regulator [Haloferax]KAB1194498.1 ArsR family transcriptional regulator [Haloferax sp. CBA1148]MRX23067.1 ArsR family transcriptional regulator [Haloferax litoreum]
MTSNMSGEPHTARSDRESLDQLFALLSHHYRRQILVLLAASNPRTVDAVTQVCLGSREGGREEERIRIGLHHVHLPKLEAEGYLEWDQTTDTIRRGQDFEAIEPALELLTAHPDALPGTWP